MKQKDVHILAIHETHMGLNTRESRNQYTWYFSGEESRQGYVAGVGFVKRNHYLKYVLAMFSTN